MLCKEQGITVTAICAVYEIFVAQKVIILLYWRNIYEYAGTNIDRLIKSV